MAIDVQRLSSAYERVEQLIADDVAVILDGGNATELGREHAGQLRDADRGLWGTGALYDVPYSVLDVHRRYVEAGCDVISTNTWAILAAAELEAGGRRPAATHWMDLARLGVRLARQAVEEAGRAGTCAVAFSVNGDIDSPARLATLELLLRALEEEPPDLVLMETMSLVRDRLTLPSVELVIASGLPVWLSFRRCRHGVCGVYGQHWGGPEGDVFGRAARAFEEAGVRALLINCLPPTTSPGCCRGCATSSTCRSASTRTSATTRTPAGASTPAWGPRSTRSWRWTGGRRARRSSAAAAERRRSTWPPRRRRSPGRSRGGPGAGLPPPSPSPRSRRRCRARGWTTRRRLLYPLPFPDVVCEPDVFVPTVGSLLLWKHAWKERLGAGRRCLDVGCGTGLLAVQLALDGAEHVHAIDINRRAVANTLANAFRNGVSERVTGAEVDLYTYEPDERYDVVVASLYQMPVDPFAGATHRPPDFWGRNLLDHLIGLLPRLLAEGGRAYVMQLSILGQLRTAELIELHGLEAKVVDHGFFPMSELFLENREQIARVEQLSDAWHLELGDADVMVAYLLELTRRW